MRVVLHEQEEAEAVVRRLLAAGFEATLEQERFAGEDDDEDHPWAVVTGAPEFMVEILAEEYDGWVDHDEPVSSTGAQDGRPTAVPLDLPEAPRRVKGHFTD